MEEARVKHVSSIVFVWYGIPKSFRVLGHQQIVAFDMGEELEVFDQHLCDQTLV